MKKGGIILLFFAALLLGMSTQRVVAQEKFVADRVIAVVGNSMILYSDLIEAIKNIKEQQLQEGYTPDRDTQSEALEMLLMQKLLASQAQLDSLPIDVSRIKEDADLRMQAMIQSMGSLQAVEKMFRKPIFQIKDDFIRKYEEMYYAQAMQQDVRSKVTITPSEVERFFRNLPKDSLPIIPEQYIYSQIVMYPSTLEQAKLRTREKLLELRERIIKGERFDLLARLYSVDNASAIRGGEMEPTPAGGLVKPFADALQKLTVNQVSPVVETEFGFHIIQLLEKKGNLYRCRHILLRPTFTSSEMKISYDKLDSIAKQLRMDSITFANAAIQYSDDKYSRLNGGVVSNYELLELMNAGNAKATTTKFLKEDLHQDYRIIRDLAENEISMPFESADLKGNTLTKIIKLNRVIAPHAASLSDDYVRIEEIALEDKQSKTFDKWITEKIDAMYIKIDPEFAKSDFKYKNWVK